MKTLAGYDDVDCSDLRDAYDEIGTLYGKEGLVPGRLEKIGYADKWTFVSAGEKQCGMAFNFAGEHAVYGTFDPAPLVELREWIGRDLFSVGRKLVDSGRGRVLRTLCVAILNALTRPLATPEAFTTRNISALTPRAYDFVRKEDRVAVVGYAEFVYDLVQRAAEVHVFDMRPITELRTLVVESGVEYGPCGVFLHDPEEGMGFLEEADVLFLTGSTLVNDTFKGLLTRAKKARVRGMFGPTAGILPEFLFAQGVSYITSSRITKPKEGFTLLARRQGARFFDRCTEPYAVASRDFVALSEKSVIHP